MSEDDELSIEAILWTQKKGIIAFLDYGKDEARLVKALETSLNAHTIKSRILVFVKRLDLHSNGKTFPLFIQDDNSAWLEQLDNDLLRIISTSLRQSELFREATTESSPSQG